MDNSYELIIIGGGPAGMTAALYASRAGLKCAMIEGEAPGGKLLKTAEIANYPGVASVNGADLAYKMYEQSTSFSAELLFNKVTRVEDGEMKKIVCEDGTEYFAKAVIVATGTKERLMGIPNEKEMTGRGVSYCAVCDAAFYRGKDVAVIGGGNSALEEAVYLTNYVNKVTIVLRRDQFRADQIAVDEALNNPKIEVLKKHVPVEVTVEDNKVCGLAVKNTDTNEQSVLPVSGIFPYIGADPCTEFLEGLDVCDKYGYMLVKEDMSTAVKGIYGAGDVCAKVLRQVVTATNDGAIAAQSAFAYIRKG